MTSMKFNKYSNECLIDEEKNIYYFNCASFVLYLLKKLGIVFESKRTCDLFEEFKNSKLLEEVFLYKDVKPGDMIIWRKDVVPKKGDSGHLAIVKEIKGNRLVVIDCVKRFHDNDSRTKPGLGFGEIEIILEDNKAIGFKWLGHSKKTKLTKVSFYRPILKDR